jgi:hypothetical protein
LVLFSCIRIEMVKEVKKCVVLRPGGLTVTL